MRHSDLNPAICFRGQSVAAEEDSLQILSLSDCRRAFYLSSLCHILFLPSKLGGNNKKKLLREEEKVCHHMHASHRQPIGAGKSIFDRANDSKFMTMEDAQEATDFGLCRCFNIFQLITICSPLGIDLNRSGIKE